MFKNKKLPKNYIYIFNFFMIFIVFINRYAYASSAGDMEYRKQIIKKLKTGKKLIFYKDSQALKKGNKSFPI